MTFTPAELAAMKSIEQMTRDILEAVAKDRGLVEMLWKKVDPQALSAGDVVFPANKLHELLDERDAELKRKK